MSTVPTVLTVPYRTYRTYLTLPYLIVPCRTLPYLSYLTVPTAPYRNLPYLTVPYCTLPYLPYHTGTYQSIAGSRLSPSVPPPLLSFSSHSTSISRLLILVHSSHSSGVSRIQNDLCCIGEGGNCAARNPSGSTYLITYLPFHPYLHHWLSSFYLISHLSDRFVSPTVFQAYLNPFVGRAPSPPRLGSPPPLHALPPPPSLVSEFVQISTISP